MQERNCQNGEQACFFAQKKSDAWPGIIKIVLSHLYSAITKPRMRNVQLEEILLWDGRYIWRSWKGKTTKSIRNTCLVVWSKVNSQFFFNTNQVFTREKSGFNYSKKHDSWYAAKRTSYVFVQSSSRAATGMQWQSSSYRIWKPMPENYICELI